MKHLNLLLALGMFLIAIPCQKEKTNKPVKPIDCKMATLILFGFTSTGQPVWDKMIR